MNSMADAYCDDIHQNFKTLYATWPPDNPIQLGDYGFMQNNIFTRMGNVKDINFTFAQRSDVAMADQKYSSADAVTVKFGGRGSGTVSGGPVVNASLDINFTKQYASFLYAAGCSFNSVEDKESLGTQIMESKVWNDDWVVVTDIVTAGKTTIVISSGTNASITLQASSAAVPSINLGELGINLSVVQQTNVGFQTITNQGMHPLLGLCKVQHKFFVFGRDWKPYDALALAVANIPDTQEGHNPDVYFGQLR